jgi:aminoglycoside phosphotransferase
MSALASMTAPSSNTEIPLDANNARIALVEACTAVDLDPAGATLIRLGSNGVFRLASAPVIVRVMRSVSQLPDAKREVQVARWLEQSAIPAVRVTGDPQPVVAGGRPVTFWVSVNDDEVFGGAGELGEALRRLHALAAPPMPLPVLDPFDRIAGRLAAATVLGDEERGFLQARLANLAGAYPHLDYALPAGVIHGDASVGNLLRDRDGIAVLSDLDGVATGAREWDLIQTAMYYERYGWHTRTEYEAFCGAYGHDVMTWNGYRTLADVKEMAMVSWLSQNASSDSPSEEELHRRIASIRTGRGRNQWRPF